MMSSTCCRFSWILVLWVVALGLAGCRAEGGDPPAPSPTVVVTLEDSGPDPTPAPTPSPTPLPKPARTLVVCLGQEPESLYFYGARSVAARSVLQALYDGPVDRHGFTDQAVILQSLPSLSNGDAVVRSQAVSAGDLVVDARGSLTNLQAGTLVRPAGCTSQDCAVTFTADSNLAMDQMELTFRLLPGLTWADGTPLSAQDSLYSFELASASGTASEVFRTDRTASYLALDEGTIQWTGVPGFLDPSFSAFFWTPLPRHAWEGIPVADLPNSERASRAPLGYGPYVVELWEVGDHIRLRSNPRYFRAGEGLPRFETLVFRFVGLDADANLAQLLSGECDLLERTTQLNDQAGLLAELSAQGQIVFYASPSLDWEHIALGIRPAAYDDGYNPVFDRPDLFGDVRTRQALAMCLDRQAVVDQVFLGRPAVLNTYIPQDHPLFNPQAAVYRFDPAAAADLLNQVGWVDHDVDPATPRIAQNVTNVPPGTPLEFTFLATRDGQRQRAAEILSASLGQCGVQANLELMDPGEYYDSGPQGPLFGRQFDLGQFAWQIDNQPPCYLYLGEAIPGDPAVEGEDGSRRYLYGWGGWNLTGYDNPEFDRACQNARGSVPGQPGYAENHYLAQEIFAEQLPAIPLYMHLSLAATRSDLCNFQPDGTAPTDLWEIELIDYGEACAG